MEAGRKEELDALRCGDRVFTGHSWGGWGPATYTAGVVSKRTPTGMIDVTIGQVTTRFDSEGKERGAGYRGDWIDLDMTYQSREIDNDLRQRRKQAAEMILGITGKDQINRNSEVDDILSECDRISEILEEVRSTLDNKS